MKLFERYLAAIDKCYVQCLNDQETEPYKSKYEARKLFEDLYEEKVIEENDLFENEFQTLNLIEENGKLKFVLIESHQQINEPSSVNKKHCYLIHLLLNYHIGTIYIDTEERNEGENRLRIILQSIEQALSHPLICSLALSIFNQLILLRTCYEQYDDAIEIAKQAENLYKNTSSIEPYKLQELISIDSSDNKNRRQEYEQIYTYTLFYLAQIHAKLNHKDESANYCYLTLERQLNSFHNNSKTFDGFDWATNCATLSQYYMTQHDYATARHCLMCADEILEYTKKLNNIPNDKLNEREASFKRCWIKYAINLLSDSSDRLLMAADRDVKPDDIVKSSIVPKFQFKLSLTTPPITCSYVLDYEQARELFLFAMNKIDLAKSYFILDGFVTDHVEICQDTSQLYSKFVFFESNIDRKCKMHKRRIDILSSLCKEISEEHYLHIIRQLLFELGECYSVLIDLKLEQKLDSKTSKTCDKISNLIQLGIGTFEHFLRTMNDKKTNERPETYSDDDVRPVLLAYFYQARLYSKFIENRYENLRKSLLNYKFIVDYVDKHPKILEFIEQEYKICKEMIDLLPVKIEKLREIK